MIKRRFDQRYAAWGIALPPGNLAERRRGSLAGNGWTINYRFGAIEGIEYLEYFASHRMTNDTLQRIYADGREELLGSAQEFYQADNAQAEQEYYRQNRAFYEDVKSRGLL